MKFENHFKIPLFAKASLALAGLYFAVTVLYVAQDIFIPIIYATLFAILLNPIVRWLVKKKLNKTLAVSMVLFIASLMVVSLGFLIFYQASHFAESLPELFDKLQQLLNNVSHRASQNFNLKQEKTDVLISNIKGDLMRNASVLVGTTIASTGKIFLMMTLVLVYVFMFLLYQPQLLNFIHKISGTNNFHWGDVFIQTKVTIQNYLKGLLAEAAIVATLNTIGLLILGIEHAVFLGIFGALLNFIPYLGALIAASVYIIIALITKDSVSYVLWIALLYASVQTIDNNFIVPKIVGSKVKINALTTFLAVVLGGELWGIHGMFLAIPITAIAKIIVDRIEPLKPFGYLMGEFKKESFLKSYTEQNRVSEKG